MKLFVYIAFIATFFHASAFGQHYQTFCVGNCKKDVTVPTQGGIVLMGGGPDVDAAFVWMIERAAGGDFLVIRSDNDSAYNPYIMELSKNTLNSVTTLVIYDREGSFDPYVAKLVANSEAIWLAGGDQW